VVSQLVWGCGGSVVRDVVAQLVWGCGGSVGGMWWHSWFGDVVAQLRGCGGSVGGMWWLSWLRQLGEPDCNAAVPGSIPASSTVS
jgi:hypothetical protein